MIIQCENCQVKFKIPDGSIGPDGRFVRCSQCEYEWLQKPEDANVGEASAYPEHPSAAPDDSLAEKLEAIAMASSTAPSSTVESPKPFYARNWFFYSSVSLLILSFIGLAIVTALTMRHSIEQNLPASKAFFEYIGMHESSGIKIEDMQLVVREINAAKNQESVFEMTITLGLRNTSKSPQFLDSVRFTVFNKDWQKIGFLDVDQHLNIAANNIEVITSRLNYVPKSSVYLAAEIGNGIENSIQNIDVVLPKA